MATLAPDTTETSTTGWLGRSLDTIWTLRLDNASITRVDLPAGRILALNEIGHLARTSAEAVAP